MLRTLSRPIRHHSHLIRRAMATANTPDFVSFCVQFVETVSVALTTLYHTEQATLRSSRGDRS